MVKIAIHDYEPGQSLADATAMEQFQKQWQSYQKLVDSDALSHKEVADRLHQALASVQDRFTILDIACGDAGEMKQVLSGTRVAQYHGIDLSGPALELAAKNLEGAPFDVELDHRDFVEALERRPEPADVAWCGLSIHHLQTERKKELLQALRKSTSKFVMIYEPTLDDGETREGYLARFRAVNRPAWTFLSEEEWHQIDEHVTTSDLPETSATWCDIGRYAGFSEAREIFTDRTGFYRLYRYDV